jgi:Pep3/Vps18/deep orange beta-propeller domain
MAAAEVEDFGFADVVASVNGAQSSLVVEDDDSQGFFTTGLGDAPLEMFRVERVKLNLNITILQVVVSNNILVMVSTDSKIYKIDLSLQEQIVGTAPGVVVDEKWSYRRNTPRIKRSPRSFWIAMDST